MVGSITEAIGRRLSAEFGEGYTVYDEEVRQGLKRPCFFVSCDNPLERLFFGTRYFRENRFCVMFYSADGNRMKRECVDAAERLFECLKWLDVNGELIMGSKMSFKVEQGVLSFFVNYDMFFYRNSEPSPVMKEISGRVGAVE